MIVRRLSMLLIAALATLPVRAESVAVRTTPVIPGTYVGAWMVEVASAGSVESTLLDAEGNLVAGPFASKNFCVTDVRPWNAEQPVWYRLVTSDRANGVKQETLVGFSEKVIRGDRLFVNGVPVRLKLGPKDLHGNAVDAFACTPEEALTNGLYRLAVTHLARLRTMKPAATPAMTRHAFQDWSVKATNYCRRLVVANRSSFLAATDVTVRWTLLVDGEAKDSGELDLCGLKAGQESVFDMPAEVLAARFGEGTVSVRFAVEREGRLLAEDQVDVVASRETETFVARPDRWWDAFTPGFLKPRVTYAESTTEDGIATRLFTTAATRFSYTDDFARAARYEMLGRWSDTVLVSDIAFRRETPIRDTMFSIDCPLHPVAVREGAHSFADAREVDGLQTSVLWTVYPSGTVACQARVRDMAPEARSRRLAVRLTLPREAPATDAAWYWPFASAAPGADVPVDWFGLGPASTTPDTTDGSFLGRWSATAASLLTVEGARGVRVGPLTVRTLGAPFAFCLAAGGGTLDLLGDPDEEGVVRLDFTLSVNDGALTARTPDGREQPLPLSLSKSQNEPSKRSETK